MTRYSFIAALLAAASPVAAQHDMHGMHHEAAVSAKAQQQIDSAAKAAMSLHTPSAATAAGFRPVFGWIPTMGEHWVARARMVKSEQTTRGAPSNLMFSKFAGKDSLVGAAYAYFTSGDDATPPALFDGAPEWHEHPDLAPPGQRLVMLHVWFVPSPDGPFAGTNPNLPYWAAGLDAPDAKRMHGDSTFDLRVRKASLAIAEVLDTTAILPSLKARPEIRAMLGPQRDSIRALIPQFKAAKDAAQWDRVAAKAAAHWDTMYSAYVGSARTAAGKQRIEQYVAMVLGQHHE